MSKTDYSACYDLPTVVRGDTVDSFRVTILSVENIDAVEVEMCRKGAIGKVKLDSRIEDNSVVVESFNTSDLHPGIYTYTMRFNVNNRERTYLTGKLHIIESCKVC